MNSTVIKVLSIFSLCAVSTLCYADALRELVEKTSPKEVKLGDTSTRMWTVEQVDPYSATFGQTFVWISMDKVTRWRVRDVQKSAKALETFQGSVPYEREVTIQGGFFGETSEGKRYPLGLIISDGKTIGKKARWSSGGALYTQRSNTAVVRVSQLTERWPAQQLIQSKPLVVEEGRNGILTPDSYRYNRVAVGVSRAGRVIVAGAFSPNQAGATLFEFAEALIAFGLQQKEELVTAIAMDGGPGAHIYIKPLEQLFGYDGSTFVPNVVDFGLKSKGTK